MKTKTTLWDAAEHLKTKKDMAAYIACALEEGDSALIAAALGDVARAQGMTKIAKRTGLGRESLYKTLSLDGNPALTTILKVIDAVGLKLKAVPA
jgi:probable addiction module antidote protein